MHVELQDQCQSTKRHWSETQTQGGEPELELDCSGFAPCVYLTNHLFVRTIGRSSAADGLDD